MKRSAPPIPARTLAAVKDAAGDRDEGYNARFVRAIQAHGLALIPSAIADYDALTRYPAEVVNAPEPVDAPGLTLTWLNPSMVVWAIDVPQRRKKLFPDT